VIRLTQIIDGTEADSTSTKSQIEEFENNLIKAIPNNKIDSGLFIKIATLVRNSGSPKDIVRNPSSKKKKKMTKLRK
jgi:hypothetical protein